MQNKDKTFRKVERKKNMTIVPEYLYSVKEAMDFLGVHRVTIYRYMNDTDNPLEAIRFNHDRMILFRGSVLLAYKASSLPKRGRRRKQQVSSNETTGVK